MDNGKDYPSSHSMDSLWYAIDECGHVAACWSCEAGAVPNNAVTSIEQGSDSDEEKDWHWQNRRALRLVDPKHIEWLVSKFRGHHEDLTSAIGSFFILDRLPDDLRREIERVKMVVDGSPQSSFEPEIRVISDKRVLLMMFGGKDSNYTELLIKIHSMGLCIACTKFWGMSMDVVGAKQDPVIHYNHPSANAYPFPYMLTFVPETLKTMDELSLDKEDVRALKHGTRIKGCFLDKPFWQPEATHDCTIYDDDSRIIDVNSPEFKSLIDSTWGYW